MAEALTQAEYIEKVHTYDRDMLQEYANTVAEVEELKATLEEEDKALHSMEAEYQVQSNELSTTIESKRDEVENLDQMIQIAAQEAEAARIRAAEEAAAAQRAAAAAAARPATAAGATARAAVQAQTQPQTPAQPADTPTPDASAGITQEPPADAAGDTPSADDQAADTNTSTDTSVDDAADTGEDTAAGVQPEPSYDSYTGNAIVDRAYGWVGRADYVWGACTPGAFDCSGFVSYCLTGSYVRLGTTYTFLGWSRVSDPQPGDVCVNTDHCGIYIGGGQMIHAATEGVGVVVGPVQGGMVYVRY